MKAVIINAGNQERVLSEVQMAQAIGAKVYKDFSGCFIAVFNEILFEKNKNLVALSAKEYDIDNIPEGWTLLESKKNKTLRRRIEDALRKTAGEKQLVEIAQILGVKTE